jgi:UrcA family protein
MSRTFKIAFVSLSAAAAALAPTALAQTPAQPASVRVAYGDLNMSTVDGGEILLRRIQSAAKVACVRTVERSQLQPAALTNCRRDTVEHTVREMNITTLTAAWGKSPATTLAAR